MRKLITASLIVLASNGSAHAFGDEVLKQVLKNAGRGAAKGSLIDQARDRGEPYEDVYGRPVWCSEDSKDFRCRIYWTRASWRVEWLDRGKTVFFNRRGANYFEAVDKLGERIEGFCDVWELDPKSQYLSSIRCYQSPSRLKIFSIKVPDKVTCWFDNCPSRLEAKQACSWWEYQAVKGDYERVCREERHTNQILGLQEGSVKKRFRY